MKFNLIAKTPHGTFTRSSTKQYTHVVVYDCERARNYVDGVCAGRFEKHTGGVHGRWFKDGGFAVTWHSSLAAAKNSEKAGYKWDVATSRGIYEVQS